MPFDITRSVVAIGYRFNPSFENCRHTRAIDEMVFRVLQESGHHGPWHEAIVQASSRLKTKPAR